MKFRPHRGTLADAMAENVEIGDDMAALLAHLRAEHPPYGPAFEPSDVKVIPYSGHDKRIDWMDVHLVSIEGWGVVGFTDVKPD